MENSIPIEKIPPGVSGIDRSKKSRLHNFGNVSKKPCVYDGVKYESQLALARKLGVDKTCINKAIKLGEFRGLRLERL